MKISIKKNTNERQIDSFMSEYIAETIAHPWERNVRLFKLSVAIDIIPFNGKIHLSMISSMYPRKGNGSAALDWLTGLAQKHEVSIDGCAVPVGKWGLDKAALCDWYARHGFFIDAEGDFEFPKKLEKEQ